MEKSAFILGASGAVGKQLVKELVSKNIFKKLVLITRRELTDELFKDLEQKIVDFDKIKDNNEAFKGFDVGFCCLGTTRGKSGASGFVKVDYDYVVNSGKVAKENGCKHYIVVSSTGASPTSPFLYPSTKGKMEEALKEIGFEQLSIFRPSMLLGERDEFRLTEKMVRAALVPFNFLFPTTASVPIVKVAKAMAVQASRTSTQPWQIFTNADIHQMGEE